MALVDIDVANGVAVVTINDPRRRNAFFPETVTALVKAMDEVEADPGCGAVVITGTPPAFCGGSSLDILAEADGETMLDMFEGFFRVARSPLPTIAAVNGAAVGAGMNLALGCDVRLVGRSGYFDTRFMKLGLHPGGGHTWMLRNIVGPQNAAALLLFGDTVGGDDAVRVGLAYRCLPDDELLAAARTMAERAAAAPRDLIESTKRVLGQMAAVDTHVDAVRHEHGPQQWSLRQPFFAEGLQRARDTIAARRQPGPDPA